MTGGEETPEVREGAEAMWGALQAAVLGDWDTAALYFPTLIGLGPAAVHSALCAWYAHLRVGDSPVTVVTAHDKEVVIKVDRGEKLWALRAARGGVPCGLDETGLPESCRSALRILAASGSNDHDTIGGIVNATGAKGVRPLLDLMRESLGVAASTVRQIALRLDGPLL